MRLFKPSDYDEIALWYKARGAISSPLKFLPKLGYIVPGHACGFLIQTDSIYAVLDNFISNPDCEKAARWHAINEIGHKLEQVAIEMGYQMTFLFTDLAAMKTRALDDGFKDGGQFTFLSKRILQ